MAITEQLRQSIMKAAHENIFETYLRDTGSELVGAPPAEFHAGVASEIERYKEVLPPLGIQLD